MTKTSALNGVLEFAAFYGFEVLRAM
jgi:hypothetical protein